MIRFVKARTSVLAIFLAILSIGYTFAQNKVVVVPLGGDSGLSGYEVVRASSPITNIQPGFSLAVSVECPEGKLAVGGGATGGAIQHVLQGSFPSTSGRSWNARFVLSDGADTTGAVSSVYAVCVDEA